MMRSKEWEKIWDKRSVDFDGKDLRVIDGFDTLSCDEWERAVYFFCDKLDIDDSDKILEIGCGCGAFLSTIKEKYNDVSLCGFDISERAVEIANREVNGDFLVIDACEDEWDLNNKFDIIFSFSVFHYFNDLISTQRVMEKSLKLLSRRGKFLIGDIPDKKHETHDRKIRIKQKRDRVGNTDHLYYDKGFFIDFAEKNNMKIEIIDHVKYMDGCFPNMSFRYSVILRSDINE